MNDILKCGWLIDGTEDKAKRNPFIYIPNGRIKEISDWALSINNFYDYSDCTTIPALVDCHTYLYLI